MFKKIGLLVLVCCLLIACRSSRQVIQESQTTTVKETKESYRDTTVFAPKAQTSLKIPVSELGIKTDLKGISKPFKIEQKNGQATVKIKVVHDTIYATASCDSLAIVAKIKKELIRDYHTDLSQKKEEVRKSLGFSFWNLLFAFIAGFAVCYTLKLFRIL
ncbi:hypothetical protein [Flavobacterium davisii]|nr:hypothetical protein [Flavobacterium davisii]